VVCRSRRNSPATPAAGQVLFFVVGEIVGKFLILLGKRAGWISWKLDEFSIIVPDLSEGK